MKTILTGDCRELLKTLPNASVQCCVTSPPYWGLRDYGVSGQLGLEKTPEEYVANMVAVFREVRRVLRDDGTMWLNLGDSYTGPKGNTRGDGAGGGKNRGEKMGFGATIGNLAVPPGLKPKDLCGIPWRVAFALQSDGWWLRQDIIWHKPNPMPESVTDRCTKSHEYIFLLTKSSKYYYDQEAIKETSLNGGQIKDYTGDQKNNTVDKVMQATRPKGRLITVPENRNKRSVWTVPSSAYSEAHFATFPPDLIRPCILAGSKLGDTVMDPFGGSGTVGLVATEYGRKSILIELNPAYVKLAEQRTNVTPAML